LTLWGAILFGYSEESRKAKRLVTPSTRPHQKWDEKSFFNQARKLLTALELEAVQTVYEFSKRSAKSGRWGNGKTGSYTTIWSQIPSGSLFSLRADGILEVHFGYMLKSGITEPQLNGMQSLLTDKMGLSVPNDYATTPRYPTFKVKDWGQFPHEFCEGIEMLMSTK